MLFIKYFVRIKFELFVLHNMHTLLLTNFALSIPTPSIFSFSNWSKSNSNYWLYYISNLIESALKVVQAIDRDARPVLVHCSDG